MERNISLITEKIQFKHRNKSISLKQIWFFGLSGF